MIALLPSEIARLILNYLEEENLMKTHDIFLDECKYLEECKMYLKRGIIVPKTIHGKTLSDYLVIDTHPYEPPKKKQTFTVGTQTEPFVKISTSVECNLLDSNELTDIYSNTKRKLSQCESNSDIPVIEIEQDSSSPLIDNTDHKCANSSKKRRLLIGKNVEKVPELTFSTIERSVTAFINDAASNFNKHKENLVEKEHFKIEPKPDLVYLSPNQDKKTDDLGDKLINSQTQNFVQPSQPIRQTSQQPQILFDLITGVQNNQLFTQTQQTPLVILPRNIETPVVSRIQALPKEPIKNIQPIVIDPFQKVHLTNALNIATQVVDTNYNTRSNRNKITNIKPKNDGKIDHTTPIEILPKKKKIYNRVTPTIRAIYAKEQQNKEENSQVSSNEKSPIQEYNETKDVHDEVGDIFDLPYQKPERKTSEINLNEFCIRSNEKIDESKNNKINKSKKSLNKSKESEDDNNEINEDKNMSATCIGIQVNETVSSSSTRTLRSRTNSQRKNF